MSGGALKEVFARFRTKVDTSGLTNADRKSKDLIRTFRKVGAAIATYFAVGQLRSFTTGLIDTLDEIDKTSQRVGIGVEALQELRFAANLSGVGIEQMNVGLAQLSMKATMAAMGGAEAATSFRALGVDVKNADGTIRDAEDLFMDLAQGLSEIPDVTRRTGMAMRLFGESGSKLIPMLSGGAAGVEELRQQFRELGGGASRDAIDAAVRAQDAMTRFGARIDGVTGRLAERFLPMLEKVSDTVGGWLDKWAEVSKGIDLVRIAALIAVPAVAALTIAMLANPAVLVAVGLAALVLVIEDLIVAYHGGESAVESFFMAHFDVDVIPLLDRMADAWFALRAFIETVPHTIEIVYISVANLFDRISMLFAGALRDASEFLEVMGFLNNVAGVFGVAGTAVGGSEGAERARRGLSDRIDRRNADFAEAREGIRGNVRRASIDAYEQRDAMTAERARQNNLRMGARTNERQEADPGGAKFKRLGQNIAIDQAAIRAIAQNAQIEQASRTINQIVTVHAEGLSAEKVAREITREQQRAARALDADTTGE
jgi:hypothetical protein